MRSSLLLLTFLSLFSFAFSQSHSPTAEEILSLVQHNQSLQQFDLQGHLRKGRTKIPFSLSLDKGHIQFQFQNPFQTLQLQIDQQKYQFYEIIDKQQINLPQHLYGKSIRDTDLTYEDISLRFLYWKEASLLEEEKINKRKTWKVKLTNPHTFGPYLFVYLWVDQQSGALLKVQGYDRQKNLIKQFEVIEVMKVENQWFLEKMRIESIHPTSKKITGITYLQLDKPKRKPRKNTMWRK